MPPNLQDNNGRLIMFHDALHDRSEDAHVVMIVNPVLERHVNAVVAPFSRPHLRKYRVNILEIPPLIFPLIHGLEICAK